MRWVNIYRVSSAKGLTILYVSSPSECSWKRRLFVASPSQQRPITLKPILSRRETASQKGSTISLPDHIGVEFLVKEYFHNPTGSLISVKCRPHCMHNSTLILGDAAHAVVPFYGQGMNAGFEDCLVYHDYLESFDNNLAKAGAQYSETRWKDAHAIADLSMYNYLEMRSHVTSRFFLFRKYIDNALNRMFPRLFVPLYSMVAFSRIPYHEVVERSSRQTRLVSYSLSAVGLCSFGLGGYLLLRGCGWPPSKILFKLALLVVAYNVKEKVEDLLHIDI